MNLPASLRRYVEKDSVTYSPLGNLPDSPSSSHDEGNISLVSRRKHSPSQWLLYGSIILWNMLLITLSVYGIKAYANTPTSPGVQPITCYCGSSIAEARDLGCKYDALAVAWLPPHCRDDSLTAEFEQSGPGPNGEWPYWADANATQPITVNEIALLADLPQSEAVFFSSMRWHVAHCAFYWRKEFRMRAKGMMMESRYDKESHIEHCYGIFMDPEIDTAKTKSIVTLGGDRGEEEHGHHHNHGH